MALTLPRWIAIATAGCILAGLGLLRPLAHERATTPAPTFPDVAAHRAAASREARALAAASDRVRLLLIRDSLLAAHPTPRSGLQVELEAGLPVAVRASLDRVIRTLWAEAGSPSMVPTLVAVVVDSASVVDGLRVRRAGPMTSTDVVLPAPATGGRCLAIVRLRRYPATAGGRQPSMQPAIDIVRNDGAELGPCLLFAAHGLPGAGIAAWLSDNNWALARYVNWNRPAPVETFRSPGMQASGIERMVADERLWRTRAYLSHSALACLAGRLASCDAALATPRAGDIGWRSTIVSTQSFNEPSFWYPAAARPFGPSEGWLVSDLARDLGPDRFRRFWTSEAPVSDAYREAAGADLVHWTRDWMRQTYGPESVGPRVEPRAAWAVLGAVLVGLLPTAGGPRGRPSLARPSGRLRNTVNPHTG